MRYMGGKSKIANALATEINRVRRPGQPVWDAFCGSLAMTCALIKGGPVWSTDANAALIHMHRAVQAGWDPPEHVSEEEYRAARALPDEDPRKAFIAVCCSFGGRWFEGYARSGSRNYAANGRNALRKSRCGAQLGVLNFLDVPPGPLDAVLYLDPPYAGTKQYAGAPPFNHDQFYSRCVQWSRWTHVFISEYTCSVGREVWSREQTTTLCRDKTKYAKAVEKLFYLGPAA